ncbi:MAG: substrate-binding domain-containing protein [Kiritimatiellae bacterium]|nr:substrate-binding domain-containing protein [Kiritimatiellia bacterium]
MSRAKYLDTARLIRERLLRGDYALGEIPGERELAVQSGVSHMTARKAVQTLLDEGWLRRRGNGRLAPAAAEAKREAGMLVGFLAPAYVSGHTDRLRAALERCAAGRGVRVRPVDYVHWSDPVLGEAIASFDGTFLVPSSEAMPPHVIDRLRGRPRPLVSLELDLTAHGIPSLDLFPTASIDRLLDHLAALGHRHIVCLNTQPANPITQERIARWRFWCARQGVDGALIDEPVEPFHSALERAYTVMARRLKARAFAGTAIVAVTEAAALGAMRALRERGFRIGRDISIGAVNDEGLARYLNPTLTALQMPDPAPYLEFCLDWMAAGGGEWAGPLLIQPSDVPLFKGESTGPCCREARARRAKKATRSS